MRNEFHCGKVRFTVIEETTIVREVRTTVQEVRYVVQAVRSTVGE